MMVIAILHRQTSCTVHEKRQMQHRNSKISGKPTIWELARVDIKPRNEFYLLQFFSHSVPAPFTVREPFLYAGGVCECV